MKTVLDYLAEYSEMSDEDLQELLNVKRREHICWPGRCMRMD